jgi:hypothetical protein
MCGVRRLRDTPAEESISPTWMIDDGESPMTADTMLGRHAATEARAGLPRAVVVVALAFGAYMAALDNSIVNAVLPVVADSFKTDLAAIEWVVTTYLLVQSALLLTFGRLGDL